MHIRLGHRARLTAARAFRIKETLRRLVPHLMLLIGTIIEVGTLYSAIPQVSYLSEECGLESGGRVLG